MGHRNVMPVAAVAPDHPHGSALLGGPGDGSPVRCGGGGSAPVLAPAVSERSHAMDVAGRMQVGQRVAHRIESERGVFRRGQWTFDEHLADQQHTARFGGASRVPACSFSDRKRRTRSRGGRQMLSLQDDPASRPYGVVRSRLGHHVQLDAAAGAIGRDCAVWDVEAAPWKGKAPQSSADAVQQKIEIAAREVDADGETADVGKVSGRAQGLRHAQRDRIACRLVEQRSAPRPVRALDPQLPGEGVAEGMQRPTVTRPGEADCHGGYGRGGRDRRGARDRRDGRPAGRVSGTHARRSAQPRLSQSRRRTVRGPPRTRLESRGQIVEISSGFAE